MLFVPFVAAIATHMAPATEAAVPAPACRKPDVVQVDKHPAEARIRPLGEEPAANQEIAVLYTEDGCIKPIIVRENVGG